MRRALVAASVTAALLSSVVGCSGDDASSGPVPRVAWIDPALDAVAAALADEPALLEVSATLEHVDVIVATDPGVGVLYRYDDGELAGPLEPRDDERETFTPDDVTIDPERIFDGVRSELDDPTIIDLAVRKEGAALVIDATVASEGGGVLLVLLGPQGAVLGSQPV